AVLPTALTTRIIAPEEAGAIFARARPWYSDEGIARACTLIRRGEAEAHIAFNGERPVAVGLFSCEHEGEPTLGHLSSAGTGPAFQRRGGPAAAIHPRIPRAA